MCLSVVASGGLQSAAKAGVATNTTQKTSSDNNREDFFKSFPSFRQNYVWHDNRLSGVAGDSVPMNNVKNTKLILLTLFMGKLMKQMKSIKLICIANPKQKQPF